MSTSQAVGAPSATSDELEQAVATVAGHASRWSTTSAALRGQLLDQMLRDLVVASGDWLADACSAKDLDPRSPEAGEEMLSGIVTLARVVRLLRESVEAIDLRGRPGYPGPVTTAPGAGPQDQVRVGVVPLSAYDRIVYPGTTAEVWMQPGVTVEQVDAEQAWAYRGPRHDGGACLVLGAGNVASLAPRDALYKLFVEGRTVVVKANPVNDYLVPHWQRAMRALVERGFLRFVRGGAEVGSRLVDHPLVDEVHVTGSAATHDALVFGPGDEGARRRAAGTPVLTKPLSAELGNVSPVIVVPGRWSSAELLYQAQHVATMIVNNAGFNCLTPRVIVTAARWDQRSAFLEALAQALRSAPSRRPYYPGAANRRSAFLAAHDDAWSLGAAPEGTAPWTLVTDVNPGRTDDIAFTTEAFCGLSAETSLPADGPEEFLGRAVDFCNEVLWGTLSATLLVSPSILRRPGMRRAAEGAVARLRYGAIGFNLWHAHAFALGSTTWGAFPGHVASDIQSGTGVVGNTLMFRRPEKSVVRGPFRSRPTPPWFAGRTAPELMRRLLLLESDPSPARLAAVARALAAG